MAMNKVTVDDEALSRAVEEWELNCSIEELLSLTALEEMLLEKYGIEYRPWPSVVTGHTVVDEQKYLVFLLKWAHND